MCLLERSGLITPSYLSQVVRFSIVVCTQTQLMVSCGGAYGRVHLVLWSAGLSLFLFVLPVALCSGSWYQQPVPGALATTAAATFTGGGLLETVEMARRCVL